MDKVVSKVTALGVPGLVLLFAVNASGFAGGAAILTALVTIGPGGIVGGIATLGIICLIVEGLSEYGIDAIARNVVKALLDGGYSSDEILKKVEKYPISKTLKARIAEAVRRYDKEM